MQVKGITNRQMIFVFAMIPIYALVKITFSDIAVAMAFMIGTMGALASLLLFMLYEKITNKQISWAVIVGFYSGMLASASGLFVYLNSLIS